ncbi:MAG: tetratricopeptide repeat protein [Bacteroidales bacterium]
MEARIKYLDDKIHASIQTRYSDTQKTHQKAVKILEESLELKYYRGQVYGKLLVALTSILQGNLEYVFEFLMEGYEYFKDQPKEIGLLLTLDSLGMYYDYEGDYEKALSYLDEGVEAAKKVDFKEGEADILSTLGKVYMRVNSLDQAIDSFLSSFQIRKKMDLKQAQASSLNLLGRAHALKGNYEQALVYYDQSIEIRKELKDLTGIVWSYIGLATMYENKDEFHKSILYYKKALDANENLKDLRVKFQICKGLGYIYLLQSEYDLAREQILPLIEISEKINSKPLIYQANRLLASYYEKKHEYEKAYQHFKKYTELKEEVLNTKTQNRIAQKQAEFEIINAKKEAEIFQLKNVELKNALVKIEEKNREITDSIKYAYRIQTALIPNISVVEKYLDEYFVFYLPKDIVSGDFYWLGEKNGNLILVAADCTGHGVPGALMSMLGVTFLTEIITNKKTIEPDKILEFLRSRIISSLKQRGDEGENKDGMDISICVYNPENNILQFAGAYNSIYLIRDNELEEIKADRMPVGIHHKSSEPFTLHSIQLQKNDIIYMFSDGFADQFGGKEGKKYKYKPFKEFLLSIHKDGMSQQKDLLIDEFNRWKGKSEQVDDVVVLGLRF